MIDRKKMLSIIEWFAIMLGSLIIGLLISLSVFTFIILLFGTCEVEITECYDYHDNLIKDLVCEKEVCGVDVGLHNKLIGGLICFLIAFGIVYLRIIGKRKKKEEDW